MFFVLRLCGRMEIAMKYEGILFDLDGTVLDTAGDIAASLSQVLICHGFAAVSPKQAETFLGNGTRRLVELSLPGDCPPEIKETVIAEYREVYEANCHNKTTPYQGMVELLRELKSVGVKTAVVSNKPDSMVRILERVYFPGIPDLVMGERPELARKPAPDMINAALTALGLDRNRCVYVGDTEVDIITAQNSGLGCISVPWGFRSREQLAAAGADPIAEDVSALRKYLGL